MIKMSSCFKTALLIFALIAISTNNILANNQAAIENNRLTYKLIFDYSDNFVYKYFYNENTDIKREYSDKSKFNFSRNVNIYFHYKSFEMNKAGFQTIDVVTDSIRHTLDSAGKKKWNFFTKDPNCFDHYNRDIAVYNLNVGRAYKYVISPYFEIADIVPSQVMINDIALIDSSKSSMKPDKFIMFRNALSKPFINQFTDVKKIDYPINRVPKDSVWKSNIDFVINGVQFNDTVEVKFLDERGGFYIMESEFYMNKFIKNQTIIYGPAQTISEPTSANLKCKLTLTLNSLGTVDETVLTAEGTMSFINQENKAFTDYIKTQMLWKADGRFKY